MKENMPNRRSVLAGLGAMFAAPKVAAYEQYLFGREGDEEKREVDAAFVQEVLDRMLSHHNVESLTNMPVEVQKVAFEQNEIGIILSHGGEAFLVRVLEDFVDVEDGQYLASPEAIGGAMLVELTNRGIWQFPAESEEV